MPYTRSCKSCADCIWFDQCGADTICDDYSPVECDGENTYEEDLSMRCGVYQEMMDEYADGCKLSDAF